MRSRSVPTVVLAGNPNCGKSSLFNGLTGARQTVGNWPGVTVERKEGAFGPPGRSVRVVDLPGIYGLQPKSQDEAAACRALEERGYDLIVNVLDATTLDRGLQFTYQLLDLGLPLVCVLTMADVAKARGLGLDAAGLGGFLGVPVLVINGREKAAARELKALIGKALSDKPVGRPCSLPWDEAGLMSRERDFLGAAALRGLSAREALLAAVEGRSQAEGLPGAQRIAAEVPPDRRRYFGADARFEAAQELVGRFLKTPSDPVTASDRIDRFLLHKIWGIPAFLVIMYLVFWASIHLGGVFIDFFEQFTGAFLVDGSRQLLASWSTPDWLIALLSRGVGIGLQTVATFIPILFTLFFFLSFLEDSGYMARAAFVMDKLMRRLGLPGKAFVPLLVGFGCTIPAVMGTRTFEQRRDRLMTVFMAPFMSCGARLPVYALFAAAFFGKWAGLAVFSFYVLGIGAAVLTGLLLKKTVLPGRPAPLLMELPPYHAPQAKTLFMHAFHRMSGFLGRAGLTIALIVALLAVTQNFGWTKEGLSLAVDAKSSLLHQGGRLLGPVLSPLGVRPDNAAAGIALVTGVFAKEAVIGTLNSLLGFAQSPPAGSWDLGQALLDASATVPARLRELGGLFLDPLGLGAFDASGAEKAVSPGGADPFLGALQGSFTPLSAYAFLLFVLLYFPCVSSFGTVLKEVGARWAWLLGVYSTLLAWVAATLVFQLGEGHDPLLIALALAVAAGVGGFFWLLGRILGRGRAAVPVRARLS